jgi:hypothetical protein
MSNGSKTSGSAALWIGRILGGLVIAFLVLDAAMKLVPLPPVIAAMHELGFASTDGLARGLGLLLLGCTILHAIPKTALLGAILLTGYLGGAIAVQLRAGSPLFSHVLFGAYVGLILWAGLIARNSRVRSLVVSGIPDRQPS